MKVVFAVLLAAVSVAGAAAQASQGQGNLPSQSAAVPAKAEDRIQREVRHELLMMPYYSVFDSISYRVQGYKVTLLGAVTRPVIKSDAEDAVKKIEGVEQVDNQIEVLPPSPQDDALRLALFRSIYGFPPLQKYELGTLKPIRIIVRSGRVRLEGVVDNQTDKNTAGIRAASVPGILGQVENNLAVQSAGK